MNTNMEMVDLKDYLCDLLEAHEVPFISENEWILPHGRLPAVRATWFPRETSGVFQVEVLLEDGRVINECFAGLGTGKEGILNGLENFCVNAFHVFLSAFWGRHDPEQVEIEKWTINGKLYNVYIGSYGTRSTHGVKPCFPEKLFESIEQVIRNSNPESDISWFRFFISSMSGDFTFESLKDNENWEAGMSLLRSLLWGSPEGYYSVRKFIVLQNV